MTQRARTRTPAKKLIKELLPVSPDDPDYDRYFGYTQQAYDRALKHLKAPLKGIIITVRTTMLGFLPVTENDRLAERLDAAVLAAGADFKKGRAFERAQLVYYDAAKKTTTPIRIEPPRYQIGNEFH